jgi:hypothetical protein
MHLTTPRLQTFHQRRWAPSPLTLGQSGRQTACICPMRSMVRHPPRSQGKSHSGLHPVGTWLTLHPDGHRGNLAGGRSSIVRVPSKPQGFSRNTERPSAILPTKGMDSPLDYVTDSEKEGEEHEDSLSYVTGTNSSMVRTISPEPLGVPDSLVGQHHLLGPYRCLWKGQGQTG